MSSSITSFYVTGGTLRLDAPSYVERQADRDLCDSLLEREFCYVLTSRQMGKSSLMVRTANKLRSAGVHVIALDLSAIGQNLTPDQWYNGLLTSMGDQLGLEDELERFWMAHDGLSPVQRWFTSIRRVVLARRPGAGVLQPAFRRSRVQPSGFLSAGCRHAERLDSRHAHHTVQHRTED